MFSKLRKSLPISLLLESTPGRLDGVDIISPPYHPGQSFGCGKQMGRVDDTLFNVRSWRMKATGQ